MALIGKTHEPSFFYFAEQSVIELAKRFRKTATPAEKHLWKRLRGKNIHGVKFRRQHPLEFFVADFYCHGARLVIEVDGPIHERNDQKLHDENRDAEFDRLGIKVIRFSNDDIMNHIGKVMSIIRNEINQRLPK